jgi:integrase
MPVIHLTDITIRSLKEGLYYDEKTPAFGIRIGKHRKTWIAVPDQTRTKITIGHYPDISLADARKKALVTLGSSHESQPKKIAAPSFKDAREQFLKQNRWRPRGNYEITRILNKHFSWNKTLEKITARDVLVSVEAIQSPNEALHAFRYIRTFFNWCVPQYIPSSPCQGLKPPSKENTRDRVLSDEELKKIWNKAAELGYPYGTICQLLILTGQRAGEIAALQWEWITDDTITIPASLAKNNRESRIPFGPFTKSIFDTVPKTGNLLFPARGHTDKPFQGFGVRKIALDKCGVQNFTHHDFRRTYATNMAALGAPIHVVEKILNHTSGTIKGVAAIYNRHSYFDEMKKAVAGYEQKLQSLLAR